MKNRAKSVLGLVMMAVVYLSTAHAHAAGALAIDENQGDQYGWAVNFASRSEARTYALQECGAGCRVVMEFSHSCAAYATDQVYGSSIYGWSKRASSSNQAKTTALNECRSHGGDQCIVRVWGCD